MRCCVLMFVVLCLAVPGGAQAEDVDGARATELLGQIQGGTGDRPAMVQELSALAPRAVPAIGAFLDRARTSTIEERRAVLKAIDASVPDKGGKFQTPSRQKVQEVKADDEFDWLAALGKADAAMPGHGEVFADIAAMRALAAAKRTDAAQVILDVGFDEATMIYRDECGRRLRSMAPYSLPPLHVASQARDKALARYSTYQLERMDRQEPGKAMSATASDADLRVTLLQAFGKAHHREAVGVVLRSVDDDASRVRKAAREAWLSYVSGPPPPPAPKKKLVMPGGKLAEKETPLWLTWRELAAIELKRTAEEVLGSVFEEGQAVDLVALSNELFAYYDGERAKRDGAAFDAAKQTAIGGDLVAAGAAVDRVLAANPELAQRADAAPIYLQLARHHEKEGKWREAATAFGKAHGVAPDAPEAVDAEAGREYALGKALEADGKDGSANFRRAVALKPDYAPARSAAARDLPRTDRPWLLYAAAIGLSLAIGFLFVGLRLRRRRAVA